MNKELLQLLRENPNCRVTIVSSSSKPRRKKQEGDVKFKRGKRYVLRHRMSDGCYVVRRGHYQYEWIQEDAPV